MTITLNNEVINVSGNMSLYEFFKKYNTVCSNDSDNNTALHIFVDRGKSWSITTIFNNKNDIRTIDYWKTERPIVRGFFGRYAKNYAVDTSDIVLNTFATLYVTDV